MYSQLARELTLLNESHDKMWQVKGHKKGRIEIQHEYERYLSNILLYLSYGQESLPAVHLPNSDHHQVLSGSFREDVRKIEEEIDRKNQEQSERIS